VVSWNAKVHWTEGLFLRPHHLQQNDRYLESAIESRTRHITPYPWGFSWLEVDRDLAQQSKFALRRGAGVMPDGGLFDFPGECPPPAPVEIPAATAGQLVWLSMPSRAANTREVSPEASQSGARYVSGAETIIDSTASLRIEEEIEVAYPRLAYEIRKTARPGYVGLPIARILEVHDRTVVLDEKFAPPVLVCSAHPTIEGWLDRVIGWIGAKLDELARYASNPTAGGGLQAADYLILQGLNREIPALKHFRSSRYVHPERLYEEFLRIAGELATFTTYERRAREYAPYDHDDLESVFNPVLRDIQDFLSARLDARAVRLELVERAANAFIHMIKDRSLFRNATFVLEVSARRPLTEIQSSLPAFLKVGPNSKMKEIVDAHLPGIPIVHLPTPPPQIRAITDHVYFYLDRTSPLWPEFSQAAAIAMHFAGDWPELQLELWAVREERR
jgi:type VI secretion system protein ImpJ